MEERVYNGFIYARDPQTGDWVNTGRPASGQQGAAVVRNPAAPFIGPKAEAEAARAQAQAVQAQAEAPYAGQIAAANAARAQAEAARANAPAGLATEGLKPGHRWVDPNNPAAGQVKISTAIDPNSRESRERLAQIKASIESIQNSRKLAEENLAVGSASEFFQNTPIINQNRRNIEAALKNAEASIIQDMVRSLAEANQGGVSGMANTDAEARRMGAAIADLNPNQDVGSLLQQLQRAEEYYLRQAAMAEGAQEVTPDIMSRYLPAERLVELQNTRPNQTQLSQDGTDEVPIPDWYQQRHMRYLQENRDNFDASQYAAFRSALDQEAGLTPDIRGYVTAGENFREFFNKGGQPQQLGVVPPARRNMGDAERFYTDALSSDAGAGAISYFNAAAGGIPARLAGEQEALEASRQNSPLASFGGEMVGGIAGALGVGKLGAIAGAPRLAASPMAQNMAYGGVYGATQSEDPLQGAAIGAGGALVGDLAMRGIGRQLPNVFNAPRLNQAIENVPSSGDLGMQADRLYRQAQAQGQSASPQRMQQFIDDTNTFLRGNNYVDAQGNIVGTGPIQDAAQVLNARAGMGLDPLDAKALRETVAEGRMARKEGAPDNRTRMFAGELTNRLDNFIEAEDVMPGVAAARKVAQQRILGREMRDAQAKSDVRGSINYSQSGDDQAIRRAFGNMEIGQIDGRKMYPPELEDQIKVVSRGRPIGNAMRQLGRVAPLTGIGSSPSLATGLLAATTSGDALTGVMAGGAVAGAGLLGRIGADGISQREAQMAELIARDPGFAKILKDIEEEAAIRAGRIGGGLFGAASNMPFREN